jgi:TPR repeat protein
VATIAWNVIGVPEKARPEPEQAAIAAAIFADTLKLAQQDNADAEYRLSHLFFRGEGVGASKQQALIWLERAAQHGNADAQYELGNAYREGSGVVQDYAAAAKWLQVAAERGHGDAQYALAQMYRGGMGVSPDNPRAYMWFNLAAAHEVSGAAAQRDAVMRSLSPREVLEAQAEARRLLGQAQTSSSAVAR